MLPGLESNKSTILYRTTTVQLYNTRIDSRKKIEYLLNRHPAPGKKYKRRKNQVSYVQVMASDHWAVCACVRMGQDSVEGERKRNQEAVNRKVERGQQRV